jgi:hypothetical protein
MQFRDKILLKLLTACDSAFPSYSLLRRFLPNIVLDGVENPSNRDGQSHDKLSYESKTERDET